MICIGHFAIAGDWETEPTPAGLLRIVMPPPGQDVFGAGWHPVTQAALLALPEHVIPNCSFAEIGAGTGILCVAAKLLMAGDCIATELYSQALEAMRETFLANGFADDIQILAGTFPPSHVDLAVVSISSQFALENRDKINASKILVVEDDATVTVLT